MRIRERAGQRLSVDQDRVATKAYGVQAIEMQARNGSDPSDDRLPVPVCGRRQFVDASEHGWPARSREEGSSSGLAGAGNFSRVATSSSGSSLRN